MLKGLRELLKTETAADISAAIASIDLAMLRSAVADAHEARTRLLLTGTNDEILAAETDIDSVRLDVERAEIAVAELERRLAVAIETERKGELSAKRDEIVRNRDDVTRTLEKEYAKHANALIAVIQKAKDSNDRVGAFNSAITANQSGEEFLIGQTAEAVFLKGAYSAVYGGIVSFANIPAAPGVGGFHSGRTWQQ